MQKNQIVRNFLKTVSFDYPKWIPCRVRIMPATWKKYRERVEKIVLYHPKIFPYYREGQKDFDYLEDKRYQKGEFVDNWGCKWKNVKEGLSGVVVSHPLKNWKEFKNYCPPDPIKEGDYGEQDWNEIEKKFKKLKKEGKLSIGHIPHGSLYMRVWYLRGFENFMIDLRKNEEKLNRVIKMVLNYNIDLIKKNLDLGAEFMCFGDDLGLQDRLPQSPAMFRKYFKPCYKKMFSICHNQHAGVYFHSDGHIVEIIPDLIETGIDIINPQIRANGLEKLKEFKGKICIDLDLDRQLFPFASPAEIRDHIQEAAKALKMEKGGLMLYAECEPDVPLENIRAICNTLEEIGGPSAWQ